MTFRSPPSPCPKCLAVGDSPECPASKSSDKKIIIIKPVYDHCDYGIKFCAKMEFISRTMSKELAADNTTFTTNTQVQNTV